MIDVAHEGLKSKCSRYLDSRHSGILLVRISHCRWPLGTSVIGGERYVGSDCPSLVLKGPTNAGHRQSTRIDIKCIVGLLKNEHTAREGKIESYSPRQKMA